ncbi:rhomboid family intramembrane serine protease [Prosthecomicrobium sp. N25]|uniref:rhomboid family intramembrane serine protease n=1 Tax=Prosthecomicrobium sp. N25 TaxID=3129254 RepID=UPI003077CA9C
MFLPLHDTNPLRHVLRPYVTWTLIAVTCLIHVAVNYGAVEGVAQAVSVSFGVIPSVVEGSRRLPAIYEIVPAPLTLVTYAFLHGDFMHLLGNMLFLWVFGDNVEDAFGHVRFLLFYLVAAAFAAIVHIATHPTSGLPLIGASGAIAAIVAAYLLLHPHVKLWVLALGRIPLSIPAWVALGAWIAFQFYNVAIQPDDTVAWWAHVGGLIAGAILVLVFRRPGVMLLDRQPKLDIPA